MSDIIKVSPEKLKSAARSLESTAGDIDKTTASMLSCVGGISKNVWSGTAASTFISRFQGLQDDITKMRKRLREQTSHLDSIADNYSKTEDQNRSSASRLKNNVI